MQYHWYCDPKALQRVMHRPKCPHAMDGNWALQLFCQSQLGFEGLQLVCKGTLRLGALVQATLR